VHIQFLVDDIVRQTTVLIAQLATAAGLRAPLARVADQVFVDLANELESQGVRRKVAADMFGLALRSYQTKLRRIVDNQEQASETLWQSMYTELSKGSLTRAELSARFRRVEPKHLQATLRDMTQSGIAYSSGRGPQTVYGLTSEADRAQIGLTQNHDALKRMVLFLTASSAASTVDELREQLRTSPAELDSVVSELADEGKLEVRDGTLHTRPYEVPVGAEQGWETAICDHFRAVASTIAAKVAAPRSSQNDVTGGATLSFRVHRGHPHATEVYRMLSDTRQRANALWAEVVAYNEKHPLPPDGDRVTFYCGQHVIAYEQTQAPDSDSVE
jgi:DNA-binding IscR family transcriptional regulator